MKAFLFSAHRLLSIIFGLSLVLCIAPARAQIITTVAGNGTGSYSGDFIAATTAELHNPTTVALDATGNLYIADWANARVRKVTVATGIITTIAGTGIAGYNFDNIQATAAQLNHPNGVAIDAAGNVYIAEQTGNRIRKITVSSGLITTLAGDGAGGSIGDGSPATGAELNNPSNLVLDPSGNIYIADWGNNKIRMISASGIISTIAGTGVGSYLGDGGAAATAELNHPYSVSLDNLNNLYISDEYNQRLRKLNLTTGIITLVAGTGSIGSSGDGFAATSAAFNYPDGIVADAGALFIADYNNNKIRKVNLSTGIVTTVFGNGTAGYAGDGGPATASIVELNGPSGVLLDPAGNVYISDFTNNRIRKVLIGNHPPSFTGLHTNHLAICENGTINITSYLTISDADTGQTETWSIYSAASLGSFINGATFIGPGPATLGTATSTGGTLSFPGSIVYVPTVGVSGLDSFVVRVNDGISIDSEKFYVTILPLPNPDAITGPTSVCLGSSINLTDDSVGGIWRSSNTAGATVSSTGVVTGISAVTNDSIFYRITNACGSDSVFTIVTVNLAPTPISPSSTPNICIGSFVNLTDGVGTGTWSVTNGFATINSSGKLTGVAAGIDTITYAIGSCSVTKLAIISGPVAISPHSPTICVGSTVLLSDATGSGSWGSGASAIASVSSGGLVSGLSAGLAPISYTVGSCTVIDTVTVASGVAPISPGTALVCVGVSLSFTDAAGGGTWSVTNSHAFVSGGTVLGLTPGIDTLKYTIGSCSASAYVTVNAAPAALTPSGGVSVCVGSTTTLGETSTGGSWTSGATGVATVNSSGVVSGLTIGTAPISYSIGGCSAVKTVTVNNAGAITPLDPTVCVGSTVLESTSGTGGTWSSGAPGTATISSGGLVTGIAAGPAQITYTIGSCTSIDTVIVLAGPSPITPSGPVTICVGTSATLSDATSGGTWGSSASGIATVSGGIVTGVAPGAATISYTSISGCSATKTVTVVSAPASIFPATSSVCVGNTVTLTDADAGGVWTASNSNATVSGGTVTGVAPGLDTITYTLGACFVTAYITVNGSPAAITPPGPDSICVGSSVSLSDGTPSGTWSSSSSATATVSSAGLVTGVAPGVVTISYANAFGCTATRIVTVSITPSAITPATSSICVGNTVTLTDGVGGGVWSSSSPTVGSVAAGVVAGISPGSTTITYKIGVCAATATVSVSAAASAGTITGPSAVCVGSSAVLSDLTTGGTWSSATPAIATVSSGGSVLGVSGGVATISYSVSNPCGIVAVSATINVVPAGVSPIAGSSTLCAGTFITLTDATTGGSWSSSNASATISGVGLVTGISPGTDTITYHVVNVCGTSSTTKIITVGSFLTAGTVTGGSTVCVGSAITLSDLAPGGIWSVSNTHASVLSGRITGLSAGVDTVSYTVSGSCGSAVATHIVTVSAVPSAGTISGPSSICIGSVTTYTNTTTGGVWSMSNTNATVSSSGAVTPISTGIDTLIYTVTNSCGTARTTKLITIGAFLTAGSITGASALCGGATSSLSDAISGGTWSISNGNATITTFGFVTAVSSGLDTVSYTVTGSCGTAVATSVVTINPLPATAPIIGPSSLCIGSASLYTNAAPGGTWSISNASATISGTGMVTPVSVGIDTISYTTSTACGSAVATKIISIGTFLSAGAITGAGSVCVSYSITLSDAVSGGAWSTSNSHAVVAGGIVTGINAGVDTIYYTISGSCGSAVAMATVTVYPIPAAGSISGPSSLCIGSSTTFTDAATGGVWHISNGNATISAGGIVTPVSVGTDTITYTVANFCGTVTATKIITIGIAPVVGAISGPATVCVGSSITLTDPASGGVWSSSNSHATISSAGLVTGITSGMDTISYTIASSCGTVASSYVVGIGASATAGSITGPAAVCASALITLSDAVIGGSWSSSNANATVSGSGVVTGVIPGTDTISYTVTGACGVGSATYTVVVNSLPVTAPISGLSAVCAGDSITLTDAAPGGVWSDATGNASVGFASGVVTGVTGGVDIIYYTVTNACGSVAASMPLTINALPAAGTITGPDSVCAGAAITLTDLIPGGNWSAGNSNATVSTSGIVTGVSGGTDPISYSVSNICGATSAILVVTIHTAASAGSIIGSSSVCVGSGITLTDAISGGSWSSSNATALMAGPGIVNGVSTGIDTIYYSVSGLCGSGTSSKVITVNPVPVVAPVSGATHQCVGTLSTLTNPTTGGIWTSSTPSVATIGSATGSIAGVSVGVASVTYTVTNIFGCPTSVTVSDTVSSSAATPAITGASGICPGSSTTLSDALPGGSWSSASPAIATVGSSSGVVRGVASGTVAITYMVATSCGTSFVTATETVNPLPVVAPVSGAPAECPGSTATVTDATPGGIWSSSSPAVAIVGSSSGIVTGITTGTAVINYTVTNSFGCSFAASITNTVNTAPSVAAITGVTHECLGASATLAIVTTGGSWSSSNPLIATVSSTGRVSGVAGGVVAISYIVPGVGCSGFSAIADTVNTVPLPTPVTGVPDVCVGGTSPLADASFGGVWSSRNPSVATVSATGLVFGVATGTSTILYSVANSCGAMIDSVAVTVQVSPTVSIISGPASVCQGAAITLSDSISGGTWSVTNSRASVSGGVVTGLSSGADTVRYTITNACSSAVALKVVAVSPLPYAGSISGFTSVCAGSSITLSETTVGGSWSSSNTAVATVSGGSVGGVSVGSATISYAVSNSCGTRSATWPVSVVSADVCHTLVGTPGGNNTDVVIFPNPASSLLQVIAPVTVNVRIFSIDGKLLIEQKEATNVNVSQLTDGMYLILVYNAQGELLKTAKFTKAQ